MSPDPFEVLKDDLTAFINKKLPELNSVPRQYLPRTINPVVDCDNLKIFSLHLIKMVPTVSYVRTNKAIQRIMRPSLWRSVPYSQYR